MPIWLPALFGAVALGTSADPAMFAIDGHVLSSGTSARLTGACYSLTANIAEPVAGFSAGGPFGLSAGFASASPLDGDTIFANNFEDCSP